MSYINYDDLAKHYDNSIKKDVENFSFPYSEYDLVKEIISEYLIEDYNKEKIKVLDIGIGTAYLYDKIIPERLDLTGIDISYEMLEIARLRFPEALFINHNVKKGLPKQLEKEKYDFIVVSYFFMHFDFEFVIYFIELFRKYLAPNGKLLIADIMFNSEKDVERYFEAFPENANPNLNYHNYEDILKRLDDGFELSYMELNPYTGMIIVEKLHQDSLQYEETLVQYNENTEKWKSTHPEKKSE